MTTAPPEPLTITDKDWDALHVSGYSDGDLFIDAGHSGVKITPADTARLHAWLGAWIESQRSATDGK